MTLRFPIPRFLFCLMPLVVAVGLSADDGKKDFTPLFNGKDFSGLKFFVTGDGDPAKTWIVKDGAVICTGKPAGYFYTDKGYKNYILRYDWRFPAGSKPESNSGCLVHIQTPHQIWPKSVEPQGRYMDHGKLFYPGGNKKIEDTFDAAALKKALRPMGEWNTTEVTCKPDGTVVVKVNGVEVASGKTALSEGPVGWQSEGSEVHFRNIQIREMK